MKKPKRNKIVNLVDRGLNELKEFNNHLRDVEPQGQVQYHDINGGFHIGNIPKK